MRRKFILISLALIVLIATISYFHPFFLLAYVFILPLIVIGLYVMLQSYSIKELSGSWPLKPVLYLTGMARKAANRVDINQMQH
jgi:hypothetical protein